ncbi:MAG: xylulokinase [Pseudomonadota bacterium]
MYLGLDLGTSGLKGLVIDDEQALVASATAPLEVSRPQSGWSEQDPDSWIAACERVFGALKEQIDLSSIKGIGLSGQMHGATALSADGKPLWPSMLWNDTRSASEASAMDADPDFRKLSGNIVFPGFTAPKIEWLRVNKPDLFDTIDKVLLPKDYLRLWLTGEAVSDMSDAAGTSWLDTGGRDWSNTLLAKAHLSREQMPRLVEGSEISGKLRPDFAETFGFSEGVVVAGGGGDNAASAIGVGVVKPGDAFVSLGTSGVLFAANGAYQPDPETAVHTFCHAVPNTWHQMGVILAATDALAWFAGLVGSEPPALTSSLGELQAPGRTVFLPYLGGERTPINDAAIRASFLGLEHATDRDAATRAVLEGVCFALRDCQVALEATGTHYETLLGVGGGTQSDYWLSALATCLGKPIDLPQGSELGGAFGAARLGLMAATGAGAEIAAKPPIAKTIEPVAALTSTFDEGYDRYVRARGALGDLQ